MIQNDSIQALIDNYESLRDLVELSNSTISNELSSASYHLGALSIIIATVGIFLGVYVTILFNKIRKIREEVDCNLEKVSYMNEQIKDIDTKINSNLSGLYSQLREEETLCLLNRLVEEPCDICNLQTNLASRFIDESKYDLFKKAFDNLKKYHREEDDYDSYIRSFYVLFFQHFFCQSVLDDELRDGIFNYLPHCIDCAFKQDIIRSTQDLCRALSVDAVSFDRERYLKKYLVALNVSKFKKQVELKNIFENQIKSITLLPNAIELASKEGIKIDLFNNIDDFAKNK